MQYLHKALTSYLKHSSLSCSVLNSICIVRRAVNDCSIGRIGYHMGLILIFWCSYSSYFTNRCLRVQCPVSHFTNLTTYQYYYYGYTEIGLPQDVLQWVRFINQAESHPCSWYNYGLMANAYILLRVISRYIGLSNSIAINI